MSYADLLKDPRWQRMRLRILERDGWTCQECGATERSLHVHHKRYPPRSKGPWEVDTQDLVTLCDDCHERVTKLAREASGLVGGMSLEALERAVGALREAAVTAAPTPPPDIAPPRVAAARGNLAFLRQEIASIDFWHEYKSHADKMVRALIEDDSPFLDHVLDKVLPDPATVSLEVWCEQLFHVALWTVRQFIETRRRVLGVEPSANDYINPPAEGAV